jgi:hypothetical protein
MRGEEHHAAEKFECFSAQHVRSRKVAGSDGPPRGCLISLGGGMDLDALHHAVDHSLRTRIVGIQPQAQA